MVVANPSVIAPSICGPGRMDRGISSNDRQVACFVISQGIIVGRGVDAWSSFAKVEIRRIVPGKARVDRFI